MDALNADDPTWTGRWVKMRLDGIETPWIRLADDDELPHAAREAGWPAS